MRILSANLSGIQQAAEQGFFNWLKQENADIVCLQQTQLKQANEVDSVAGIPGSFLDHYQPYFFNAQQADRGGVAILCKQPPKAIMRGLGAGFADHEGRYIQADYEDLSIASLLLPSGQGDEEQLTFKHDFAEKYLAHLKKLRRKRREFIICGSWYMAHKAIDRANGQDKLSNNEIKESHLLDQLFDSLGYIDAFRVINQRPKHYSWWANDADRQANQGFRFDYQVVSPGLRHTIYSAEIYNEQSFSNHATVLVSYHIEL
jgi:exodeoxyribonuclease-3